MLGTPSWFKQEQSFAKEEVFNFCKHFKWLLSTVIPLFFNETFVF